MPINSASIKTIVDEWMRDVGGVLGKLYGIQCDIVPKERICERVAAAMKSVTLS